MFALVPSGPPSLPPTPRSVRSPRTPPRRRGWPKNAALARAGSRQTRTTFPMVGEHWQPRKTPALVAPGLHGHIGPRQSLSQPPPALGAAATREYPGRTQGMHRSRDKDGHTEDLTLRARMFSTAPPSLLRCSVRDRPRTPLLHCTIARWCTTSEPPTLSLPHPPSMLLVKGFVGSRWRVLNIFCRFHRRHWCSWWPTVIWT